MLDPVFVGAEDQRFGTDLVLQEFFRQRRTLVGAVVFLAQQGDVLGIAQGAQRDGQLHPGLRGSDNQQPGGCARGRGLGAGQ